MARQENMTPDDIAAAKRLKKIWLSKKKEKQLTEKMMADRYGGTQPLINHMLNARQSLTLKWVLAFAVELGESPLVIYPELLKGLAVPSNNVNAENDENSLEFMELYRQCPPELQASIVNIMRLHLQQ